MSLRRPGARFVIAAVGGLVVAGMVTTGASATTVGQPAARTASPSAAVRTSLPAAQRTGLIRAYAKFENIPVSDIGRIVTGSVHAAVVRVSGVEWVTAGFVPSQKAPLAIQDRFQDGGSAGVFTRHDGSAWQMRDISGEQLSCDTAVPAAVRAAWGLTASAACQAVPVVKAGTAPKTLRAADESGTTGAIATIALNNLGVQDTPVDSEPSVQADDCDPYTSMLVLAGQGNANCGVDPTFDVRDTAEWWCADFAKWVWEQGGVTTDLSVLNAGADSFGIWAGDQGESTTFDSGTPEVGDAIVLYPSGTTSASDYADHVALIVGVNSNGTVDIVNGDWYTDANYAVAETTGDTPAQYAAAYASGEEYLLVSPNLPTTTTSKSSPVSATSGVANVAFIDSNGEVVNDYYGTSGPWAGPAPLPGTPRSDSPVVISADGDNVFFIASNGEVVNDAYTSSGWEGPYPTDGSAEAGSGLAITPDGSNVFFIATNGEVVNDYYSSSAGWSGPAPTGGDAEQGSGLATTSDGDNVFFIATNGEVVNDYVTSSGWAGPAPIGGTAEAGSAIAATPDGDNVFFIDSDGAVVNDYYSSSAGWAGPAPTGGNAETGSGIAVSSDGDNVFFIAPNGEVVNDYYGTSGPWAGPAPTGGTAEPDSGIAVTADGDNVFFVAGNGEVVNDYYSSSAGWSGPGPTGGSSQ
ncbi:MAG: CHAP domain-containing protein [Streptosporangiaceae bacterium]